MYDFRKLKFNPIWIALGTIWLPHLITRLRIPEVAIVVVVGLVILIQIYFVYLGVERLRAEKEEMVIKKKKKKA